MVIYLLVLTLSGQKKCAFYQLETNQEPNNFQKKANTNIVSCISNKDLDHSNSCIPLNHSNSCIPLMDQGKMRKLLIDMIKQ
jgi:hypothetical protein